MKAILLVIENCFMLISICVVEFRSPTLHNLDIAERVMIMRFALLGLILYLGKCYLECYKCYFHWLGKISLFGNKSIISGGNVIRLALMSEQAYSSNPNIDQSCVTSIGNGSYMASPFNKKCLNYAEIVMLTLVALATLVALIVLISNLVLHQRLNNYR